VGFVRHVEGLLVLRLILPIAPLAEDGPAEVEDDTLGQWVKVVNASLDACLVVDEDGRIAAVSGRAADLIGEPADGILDRALVDDVLRIVDFTHAAAPGDDVDRRIPPIAALRDDHLSRGLLRLMRPDGDLIMLDAVAAPIHDDHRRIVGAITFFASL
jgi:PAS domain-containing protein